MTAFSSSTVGDLGRLGRTKRILVIGNSHTQSIRDAVGDRVELGKASQNIEVCWLVSRGKGDFGDTTREDAIAKIRGLHQSDLLVLSALGTLHSMIGLFDHELPFQLVETANGSVKHKSGTEIIPLNVMRDLFREHVEDNPVFKQMVDQAPCPVVHFMPPPPKESFARSGKTRIVDGVTVQLEFAPKEHRLALWKLEESLVANYVKRQNVIHQSTPLRARNPDGFLAPGYHANDATHANGAFGELLLQDFERMLYDLPPAS